MEPTFGGNAQDNQTGGDWLSQFEEQYQNDPDFIAGGLALRVIEDAVLIMQERGLSRTELAKRMQVSRAYVTQVLNARPNLTLRSIAQLAIALNARPSIRFYASESDSHVEDVAHDSIASAAVLGLDQTLTAVNPIAGFASAIAAAVDATNTSAAFYPSVAASLPFTTGIGEDKEAATGLRNFALAA